MFTGIIETTGTVTDLRREGENLHITIQSDISSALHIDQSVSHNGICLTVVAVNGLSHGVTAVRETIFKTNLDALKAGDRINLERCLQMGGRLDGHIVQGHVDTTASLISVEDQNGSYLLTFLLDPQHTKYIVDKGSISVNGISLTVVKAEADRFSVAIIPYTWENTNLRELQYGNKVNIEFDIIGKYVERMMQV